MAKHRTHRPTEPIRVEGVPHFANEDEEARYFDEHPELLEALFLRAAAAGKLKRRAPLPAGSATNITIRMPVTTLERAKRLAERKGLRYQTYLKMLIHEGLEREDAGA